LEDKEVAKHHLVVTEEAEADIREGFRWYQQETGLGADFVAEVKERLAFIEQNPFAYQVVKQGIRRAVVHRFPYNVYIHDQRIPDQCACGLGGQPEPRQTVRCYEERFGR